MLLLPVGMVKAAVTTTTTTTDPLGPLLRQDADRPCPTMFETLLPLKLPLQEVVEQEVVRV
jgi:hypothetical protein